MKKPDRGPNYRWDNGVVMLREIKRPDLVKDPYRVRGQYTKEDGRPGTFDAMNWRAARGTKRTTINKDLEEGRAARSPRARRSRSVWKEWDRHARGRWEPGRRTPVRNEQTVYRSRYLKCRVRQAKPIDTIVPIDAERWLRRWPSPSGAPRKCVRSS